MDTEHKKRLVVEHAQLTAAHAAGNKGVIQRLREIEDELQLGSAEIATLAITEYLRDY